MAELLEKFNDPMFWRGYAAGFCGGIVILGLVLTAIKSRQT